MYAGPHVITDGLALCWDPANPKSYPGSGTSINDLIGSNTTITQTNGTIAEAGISGSTSVFTSTYDSGYLGGTYKLAFTYNASTDLAAIVNVTSGGWTIEEWINIKGLDYPQTPAGSVFSSPAYGTGAVGFDWNHGNSMGMGTLRVGASDGGGTGYEVNDYLTVDTNLSILNKWQCRQIIWDRDNGEIRNHINGILQDTGDISSLTNSLYDGSGATIGTLYGWYHYGDRSLTKIYNRVLSPTELQQNYNALKNRFGL
jgi:hypothetical protein